MTLDTTPSEYPLLILPPPDKGIVRKIIIQMMEYSEDDKSEKAKIEWKSLDCNMIQPENTKLEVYIKKF